MTIAIAYIIVSYSISLLIFYEMFRETVLMYHRNELSWSAFPISPISICWTIGVLITFLSIIANTLIR